MRNARSFAAEKGVLSEDAMTSVGSIDVRRTTEDLIDEWAHDASIAAEGEHVKSTSGLRSQRSAWDARHGDAKAAGSSAAEAAGPELALTALEGLEVGVLAFGAGLVTATLASAAHWYYAGWVEPNAKGDNLRALAQNDAVNVALANGLDFHSRFGAYEAAKRPAVQKATERLLTLLGGRDAPLKSVLQERADRGFVAAERAFAATARLEGSPERAGAIQQWMKDNGFSERMRGDAAFGKGAEYFFWLHALGKREGVDRDAEMQRIHERLTPPHDFHCRG